MTNLTPGFNKVAVVFKTLFPLRVFRWLVYFSAFSLALSSILVPVLGIEWLYAFAFAGIVLSAFMGMVIVPMQLITLVSSRPISLLGNSRQWLLGSLAGFGFVISLAIYWSISRLPNMSVAVPLLVIWLMVSLVLQLGIVLCSRWQGVNGFIFLLNPFFDDIALWLTGGHPLVLLAVLVVSWAAFSTWWLRWKPGKYQSNNMMLPSGEMHKQQMEKLTSSRLMIGNARTWIGARLLGFSDGWSVLARRILGTLALVCVAPLPLLMIMDTERFWGFFQVGSVIFLIVMAGGIAQSTAINLVRNLRAIWLYSSGMRSDLFFIALRAYVREVGAWSLLMTSIAIAIEVAFGSWRGYQIWVIFLGSMLLLQAFIFHVVWFVYKRKTASLVWCNWICIGIFLTWLYTLAATGLLFPLPFDWQGISTLWVWVPELLAIAALHKKVRAGFFNMDLLRVV